MTFQNFSKDQRTFQPWAAVVLAFLSAVLYVYSGYFLVRHESVLLFTTYLALFVFYWMLHSRTGLKVSHVIGLGLVFRLLLLFSFPALSDDIYRFVWDGKLLDSGIHPFSHLPSYFIDNGSLPESIDPALYDKLNSPDYFTIYPPVAQFLFWVSAGDVDQVLTSAIIIRSFIIAAETGSLLLMRKLCKVYSIDAGRIGLYALNPLVILELSGNLHFEAFMIFFILGFIYLYKKGKLACSGIGMGLAICSKLLPLMFLPLFLRRITARKVLILYTATALTVLLCFFPLFDLTLFKGMYSSLSLYFQKFEFNASIYYLVREVGYLVTGYNIIGSAGPWLSIIALVLILFISFFPDPKQYPAPVLFFWILLIYLLFATTVHPWYITSLVALSVFTGYRFVIVWSGVIFLTYMGYTETTYQENMLFVVFEYLVIFIFAGYELYRKFKKAKFKAYQALE